MSSERRLWNPGSFTVYPLGKAKTSKKRSGGAVRCWDIRGQADGIQWQRRLTAPEHSRESAQREIERLRADWRAGLLWDAKNRRFVPDQQGTVTVVEMAAGYWHTHVAEWSPRTREWAAKALTHLLVEMTVADPPVEVRPEDLFRPDGSLPSMEGEVGRLSTLAMPLGSVQPLDIERARKALVGRGGGPAAPATEKRWLAVVRAMFSEAVRMGWMSPPSPAEAVRASRAQRSAGRVNMSSPRELVLSPEQVLEFAAGFPEHLRAFVLLMGLSGLRPSEAIGLQMGDVEDGWVTVSRSAVTGSGKWRTDSDPAVDNPLKGRSSARSRRAPIPEVAKSEIVSHIQRRKNAGAEASDPLFVGSKGGRLILSNLDRVWKPAVAAMFPEGPLAGLRRHDLRHTACTMWLNAGVAPKVAMGWSGHSSLQVFLDVYQGRLAGDDSDAATTLNDHLQRRAE